MATVKVKKLDLPDVEIVLSGEEAQRLSGILGALSGPPEAALYDLYCAISGAIEASGFSGIEPENVKMEGR